MFNKKSGFKAWLLTEKGFWVSLCLVVFSIVAAAAIFGCAAAPVVRTDSGPLPAPEPTAAPESEEAVFSTPAGGNHYVLKGECLWTITGKELGDPFLWPLVWKANRDFVKEPDWIEAGDTLEIPYDGHKPDEHLWAQDVAARWPRHGRPRGEKP